MQKIITRAEKEKKTKRNQLIIGIILILVMMFSSLSYAFSWNDKGSSGSKKIEYNGIEFTSDDSGYWNFNKNGVNFLSKYTPEEVSNISFSNSMTLNDYSGKPLYLVGNYPDASAELTRNLNKFVSRFNYACLSEEDCEGNYPVKNCSQDNILVINETDSEESIIQEENCIIINAGFENQTRFADIALYKILGLV